MNRISKTTFLKYLRCPRAAAFESEASSIVYDYKSQLSEIDDLEKSKLLVNETKEKLRQLFSDMIVSSEGGEDSDDEILTNDFDVLLKDDQTLKMMMDTYFQIEELSSAKAEKIFGGQVIAGVRQDNQVIGQRLISLNRDGLTFYSFVDTYQEDDKTIRIIESKSTTSRKFVDLGPTIKKEFKPLFEMSPIGVLYLKEEIDGFVPFEKYYETRSKLFDRVGDLGRYVYDLAWQRYVIENSSKSNKDHKYYLSVLNTDYIYDGKKDNDGNNLYNFEAAVIYIDLTRITEEMMPIIDQDFRNVIDRIEKPDLQRVALEQKKCLIGKGYRECPWLSICKKDYKIPEKNSIYIYLGGHNGFGPSDWKKDEKYKREELVEDGIINALDINYDWLSDTQKIQYRVLQSKNVFAEKPFMAMMLKNLQYPLFHLDFETMNYPLPMFIGEKPYQQSLFQYSLHIESKPGICDKEKDNISFLSKGKDDDREKLVVSLISNIPEHLEGTVIVYNQSFEKARLKELAAMFPKYREALMSIHDRVFDLMHFLKPNDKLRKQYSALKNDPGNIAFYSEDLQRSYSIKKVLPIFAPHLNYANLDEVHNGIEAQVAFMRLKNLSGDMFQKTYSNMIEYCKQDTWAMYEVLQGLRKLIYEK